MTAAEPLRYVQYSDTTAQLLAAEGESGRFEFKETSQACDATVLVAAANWVALDPARELVTILVGVREVTDPATKLTRGEPVGLGRRALDQHIRRIQDVARTTEPVPVGLRIIEEGVATEAPILRVEVRPTFAPHYDGKGRRVTRDGASHRALVDQELLDIYLDRERDQFELRFRETARETLKAIDGVRDGLTNVAVDLDSLPGLISNAEAAATIAGHDADDAQSATKKLATQVEEFESKLAWHAHQTPLMVFYRLRWVRKRAWRSFAVDRALRPSKSADRLAPRILAHLNEPVDLNDFMDNLALVEFWAGKLKERVDRRPASMKWWGATLKSASEATENDAMPALTDDSDKVAALVKDAETWGDVELERWPTEL